MHSVSALAAPRLSRKEREFRRRRTEILEIAEVIFADKGFLSTTMEEIAERAEFSVGMLYRFFKSKADLYLAIIESRIAEFEGEVHRALEEPSRPRQKLEAYFSCRIGQFWVNPAFFRLILQGTITLIADPRSGLLPELQRKYQRLVGRLESLFEQGISRGDFRHGDPAMMSLALEGLIRAYLFHLSENPTQARNLQQEHDLLDQFFHGVAAVQPASG